MAKSQFQMDEELQERIYEQATEEGMRAQSRVLLPSAPGAVQSEQPPPSIFISRDLRLDEITKDRDQGLISRFVEDRLSLLFWKKLSDGELVGCVISDSELRERLIMLIPDVYTEVRILTLVDEKGQPLVAPEESEARDYRRPFVARELSAVLPLWEAAAYLTDPDAVTSQAGPDRPHSLGTDLDSVRVDSGWRDFGIESGTGRSGAGPSEDQLCGQCVSRTKNPSHLHPYVCGDAENR